MLWLLACSTLLPAHADSRGEECSGSYSVLRNPQTACVDSTNQANASRRSQPETSTRGVIDEDWLKAQMAAFAVIGVAHVRGGPELLGNIWYTGAVVIPPVLTIDHKYGYKKNYLAITPPFLVLGLLNTHMDRDGADDPRVFLTNFIGFNLGLWWSRTVLAEPHRFLDSRRSTTVSLLTPNPASEHPDAYGLRLDISF